MSLFSASFFLFFPIAAIIYHSVPEKLKKYILLSASIYFYFSMSMKYCILLVFCILTSYLLACIIEEKREISGKIWLIIAIFVFSLVLLLFKSLCFYITAESPFYHKLFFMECSESGIIFPIGMGFFILQIIGYLCDVYKGKITTSVGIIKYSLYICFFPKIISGPILDYHFFDQLSSPKEFNYERTERGLYTMLLGYGEKLLLANCIVKISDEIFTYYQVLHPLVLIGGAVAYAFFLYFDFSGYSHIAIGAAAVFGFDIPQNFSRPYLAESIKEFWRRWHISLSEWLKTYIYIPLGGNRRGTFQKYINLFLTFWISGIWHGIGLQYVFWGMLHGVYQIAEDFFSKFVLKGFRLPRAVGVIKTFILVDIAWIFFRSANLTEGIKYIFFMFTHWEISLEGFGMEFFHIDSLQLIVCILALVLFVFLHIFEEKGICLMDVFIKQQRFIKWGISMPIVFLIFLILFRTMGEAAASFVYAQF